MRDRIGADKSDDVAAGKVKAAIVKAASEQREQDQPERACERRQDEPEIARPREIPNLAKQERSEQDPDNRTQDARDYPEAVVVAVIKQKDRRRDRCERQQAQRLDRSAFEYPRARGPDGSGSGSVVERSAGPLSNGPVFAGKEDAEPLVT